MTPEPAREAVLRDHCALPGSYGTWRPGSIPAGVRAGRVRRVTWNSASSCTACGYGCHADVNAARNDAGNAGYGRALN